MWNHVLASISRLRFVLTRRRQDADGRLEVEEHVAQLVDRYVRSGMTPGEARLAARRQFGNVTALRERLHHMNSVGWFEGAVLLILKELQHAVRNLRRASGFSLACVFTLTLAIAGTATLVSLLETFVVRRLAVAAPEQLVGLDPTRNGFSVGFSSAVLQALADRQQMLTDVCGVTTGYGALGVQFENGVMRQRPYEAVSGTCYELLGLTPAIGRLITREDAPLSGDPSPVALISHRVWQTEFAASPDVVGRTLRLEGYPLTIIGVLPHDYRGLQADEAPAIALPLTLPWKLQLHPPLAMRAVGRLRPGTRYETAAGHLTTIWAEAFNSGQGTNAASQSAPILRVEPLANGFSRLRDRYRRPLSALVGLAACLLVLACVNVGGLSFARLLDRREALAVQLALGAGRPRLVVQVLCEALLIGISATCLAIPIARWTAHVTTRLLWNGYGQPTLDVTPLTTMVLFMGGLGALATIVAGAPALIGLGIQHWDLSARNVGHGAMTGRRRAVIAVQIALCLVLTFCAALFVANLRALGGLPLGYEPDRLTWAHLNFKNRAPSAAAPTIGYIDSLLSRIEGLPGVEFAALSQAGFGTKMRGFLDPVPARAEGIVPNVDAVIDLVSPGFFRTTAISMQQGRDFTWNDVRTRANIAIVNRSLAARLFDKGDALGRTIRIGRGRREQALSIVGIVADATPGDPRFQHVPQCYLPLAPEAPPIPTLLLRLGAGSVPEELLRKEIEPWGYHEVLRATTMTEQIDRLLVQERLIRSTSVLFAVLAGVVSIAGLYAALSQSISRRTREIGIRAALGATPNRIRALIFTEVSWILLIGVGLGVPAAWTGGRAARMLLSHAPANFLTLLAGVGFAIVVVAAFVAVWPAQRATRVPTATALRAE